MNDVPKLNATGVTKSNPEETSGYKFDWSASWENYIKGEYYQRVQKIMLDYGMGTGDTETILWNLWISGWFSRKFHLEKMVNRSSDGVGYRISF